MPKKKKSQKKNRTKKNSKNKIVKKNQRKEIEEKFNSQNHSNEDDEIKDYLNEILLINEDELENAIEE